jgi:hypothetical protein
MSFTTKIGEGSPCAIMADSNSSPLLSKPKGSSLLAEWDTQLSVSEGGEIKKITLSTTLQASSAA